MANDDNPEIERKYLLSEMPWGQNWGRNNAEIFEKAGHGVKIAQGYLPGKEIIERLRSVTSIEDNTTTYLRTIKFGKGLAQTEYEEECSKKTFGHLWELTEGRRVFKRRYCVEEGNHTWEIDYFTDRNLVLAEVELTSVDEDVTIPLWLQPYVVREVTEESEYTNYKLSK